MHAYSFLPPSLPLSLFPPPCSPSLLSLSPSPLSRPRPRSPLQPNQIQKRTVNSEENGSQIKRGQLEAQNTQEECKYRRDSGKKVSKQAGNEKTMMTRPLYRVMKKKKQQRNKQASNQAINRADWTTHLSIHTHIDTHTPTYTHTHTTRTHTRTQNTFKRKPKLNK